VAAVEPAGEVETADEPGSSARKQVRVNRITGREIVGLGYLVLGEVVKKSKEGSARMGAKCREVSSFRANGGEAVDTGRRLAQPGKANPARLRAVANLVQPRTTDPTRPRVVTNLTEPGIANPTRPEEANPTQPRAANLTQPGVVNPAHLRVMFNTGQSKFRVRARMDRLLGGV
jgi:hypothetical protein